MIRKSALFLVGIILFSAFATAQDFISRFMETHQADSNLVRVTVSSKMLESILSGMEENQKNDTQMGDILSELKSVQMISSTVQTEKYKEEALEVLKKNANRFEPYLSFEGKEENCKILVRKKKDQIIELVMLMYSKDSFSVLNLTGIVSLDFIAKLTSSVDGSGSNKR
jgi:hypothetical protein